MSQHYKGYSLFNDVEDKNLRIHNRGTVLANIYEDNPDKTRDGAVSKGGALLIFGYFQNVPKEERKEVADSFESILLDRGFKHA